MNEEIVEFSTVEEAVVLLDQWIAVHKELRREYLRLEWRHAKLLEDYENAVYVIEQRAFIDQLKSEGKWLLTPAEEAGDLLTSELESRCPF